MAPAFNPASRAGELKRRVAINVDLKESTIQRLSNGEFEAGILRLNQTAAGAARNTAAQTEEQQGYWRYGLMAMLAALVAEGLIGIRLA